jgi:hypothetical protein
LPVMLKMRGRVLIRVAMERGWRESGSSGLLC